jgi:soluble lytic murein transglycosylase-like protein
VTAGLHQGLCSALPLAAGLLLAVSLLLHSPTPLAGNQLYEPLAADVRIALRSAIAERRPPRHAFDNPLQAADWLSAMSQRLERRLPDIATRLDFLRSLHYEASRAGLDPQLVLSLIEVESGFQRYAVSSAGARGLMQVMPFWADLIGDGNVRLLFDMRSNLRFGCVILRHYLDLERGDLFRALGRYNGSLGKPDYPDLVLATLRNKWQLTQAHDTSTTRRETNRN